MAWTKSVAPSLVIRNLHGAIVGPVDLIVTAGTCAAITGPSGAGKSLFLRMIADLDPNDGNVRLGDIDRRRIDAPDWRRQVAYLAAESGWWAPDVAAHFPPATHASAKTMAASLGVPADVFARDVATLSTGERQRLALVRALVREPKALLLDEPTGALDAASIGRVEDLLRDWLANGLIIILVSHDPAQAARLATTRHTMTSGRLT